QPTRASEGSLKDKLADVRAKADQAREAKLRANVALYEGLSAAYDFALDAEEAPEDYLRLVEAQGLKIQLRSPMKPVVKLAFDGIDCAFARQIGENRDLSIVRRPRQPVSTRGDAAQILDCVVGKHALVGEQLVEDRFREGLFELQADELLAMPGNPAKLVLEAG